MSDLRTAVAFLFQRAGRDALTPRQIRHQVSMDLRWFDPGEARTFVDAIQERGLVEEADDGLQPTFDVRDVDVDIGFSPDLDVEADATPFDELLDRLTQATGWDEQDAVARINEEQSRFDDLVEPIVAGLVVARQIGVDVDDLVDGVLRELTGTGEAG